METTPNFVKTNSNVRLAEKLTNVSAVEENHSSFSSVREAHHCPFEDCNFSSTWKASLNNHKKTHTDERPWQCVLCNKHFRLKHHLKHHILTHSQTKPFKCLICEYRCHDVHSLHRHKVNKHKFPSKRKALSKALSFPTMVSLSSAQQLTSSPEQFMHNILSSTQNNNLHASSSTSDSLLPSSIAPVRLPTSNLMAISDALLQKQQNLLSSTSERSTKRRMSDISASLLKQNKESKESDISFGSMDDRESQSDHPSIVSVESVFGKDSSKNLPNLQSYWSLSRPNSQKSFDSRERSSVDSLSSDKQRQYSDSYAEHLPVFESCNQNQSHVNQALNSEWSGMGSQESEDDSVLWKCSHCFIVFPDNIMYGLHMGCHSVIEPFQCNICGKKCADRHDFMFHFTIGKHSFK